VPRAWGPPHKSEARDGRPRAGLKSVQLRFQTGLTSEEYVSQQAWRSVILDRCPLHVGGGCGFSRHTGYERVEPPGAFIARYYCPKAHLTVSLLPDCLASRMSSTLVEIEQVALRVEVRQSSQEMVAATLRPDIQLPGALRWVRRRAAVVASALLLLKGLRPDLFADVEPTVQSFRAALGVERVLPALREIADSQLAALPPPVGFAPRRRGLDIGKGAFQQKTGPDPPRRQV